MDGGPLATPIGAKLAGARTVVEYSAPPPDTNKDRVERLLGRWCYAKADICLAMSECTANAWKEWLRVPGEKFRVIPNGDDYPLTSEDDRRQLRDEWGIPPNAKVVGMTGRMTPYKGCDLLVDAATRVLADHPDSYFVFAGDGPSRESQSKRVAELGLSERVRFLGFRPDPVRVTAAYDIAVVPSIFPEPFGLVVIEAMSQRVPVIASRVGGIPEIVENGSNGILFEREDLDALTQNISRLLGDAAERERLGEAGRQTQLQRYNRATMLNSIYAVYDELLD